MDVMYVKRYVQMLPEPNAESAERHTVGLFTLSSTEGHGILHSSSVPMRLPIGVDFSPPFSRWRT